MWDGLNSYSHPHQDQDSKLFLDTREFSCWPLGFSWSSSHLLSIEDIIMFGSTRNLFEIQDLASSHTDLAPVGFDHYYSMLGVL